MISSAAWHISHIKAAVLSALLVMALSPSLAMGRTAPLPEGLAASNQGKVQGLYAESQFGRTDVNEAVATLEENCKGRGTEARIDGRELLWRGMRRIYRTRDNVAVIEDAPTIEAQPASCSARISLRRNHIVSSGSPDSLQAAGWIEKRPTCGARIHRCTLQTIAGVSAQCVDLGDGLVGSTLCYSTQNDLSKGLIVGGSNYTDDGSGPDNSWGLDKVIVSILIDPVVFRSAR
jgi:hypothetical protein